MLYENLNLKINKDTKHYPLQAAAAWNWRPRMAHIPQLNTFYMTFQLLFLNGSV